MKYTTTLKAGTILRHTYKIERVLGQGGFGITYLAIDTSLDRKVAIKEFFPKDFCDRDETTSHVTLGTKNTAEFVNRLKAKFLKEARNIAKFDHPNIIRIYAAFEENNTAYYVMEYIEGESLSAMVKRSGPLPEKRALGYIEKVGEALEYVHASKINHLDIKPANIMVRMSDDTPILIDFGLSKQYDSDGNQTSTMPPGFSHGFAPMEQYNEGGVKDFTPQTDIYSLAATLYYILSGVVPIQATRRNDEELTFPDLIPQNLVAVISKAMSPGRKGRHETIREFLDKIRIGADGNPTIEAETEIEIKVPHRQETTAKKSEHKHGSYPVMHKKPDSSQISKTSKSDSGVKPKSNKKWYFLGGCAAAAIILVILVFREPSGTSDISDPTTSNSSRRKQNEIINNLISNMVYVEGGSFTMGSDDSEAYSDEEPAHRETVRSFSIGKYEVTQREWKAVMGNNPSYLKGDDLPVENVSWDDCQQFIRKLNALTGRNFRLPTESEWEFAARGGNLSNGYKYSGSNDIGNVAWYADNSGGKTHPVGTKRANELGLHDMSGNVWEWTSSNWCEDYSKPRNSSSLVARGGSWNGYALNCRVSLRFNDDRAYRSDYLGLRLVF